MRLLNRDEQVIAPSFITLRVANRSALTGDTIASGTPNLSSIHFGNQGKSTGVSGALSNEFPVSSTEMNAESSGELGI